MQNKFKILFQEDFIEINYKKDNIKSFNDLNKLIINQLKINDEIEIYLKPQTIQIDSNNFSKTFYQNLSQTEYILILIKDENTLDKKIDDLLNSDIFNNVNIDNKNNNKNNLNNIIAESIMIKKKHSNNENKNQKKEKIKIFNDKCKLCNNELIDIKYICSLCDDLILCEKCEENHIHPMVKFKNLNYGENFENILNFYKIKNKDVQNKKNIIEKIFKKKDDLITLSLTLGIFENNLVLRPNQNREFLLKIKNNSKTNIEKNKFSILFTNYKNLNIVFDNNINEIKPNDSINIPINIFSGKEKGKYDVIINIFSKDLKLISNQLILKVEVNEDKEDDDLNEQLKKYNNLIILPKNQKKIICYVYSEKLSVKQPDEIYLILNNHKWNVDEAIDDLLK